METESFTGYVTRLDMIQVTHPLHVRYSERTVQLVGDGYSWLQQFPSGKKHVVTTMFDEHGKIVQRMSIFVFVTDGMRTGFFGMTCFWILCCCRRESV